MDNNINWYNAGRPVLNLFELDHDDVMAAVGGLKNMVRENKPAVETWNLKNNQ